MLSRSVIFVTGIFYILIGILGFMPGLLSLPADAPPLWLHIGYGYLFGVFPVNLLLNFWHLSGGFMFTIEACHAYARGRSYDERTLYGRILTIFGLLGLFPFTRTLFGLAPLFGSNILLHSLTGIIAFVAEVTDYLEAKERGGVFCQDPAS